MGKQGVKNAMAGRDKRESGGRAAVIKGPT